MQIGNSDLDKVFNSVIYPTLKSCNLDPKRVDKHNEGNLLKSEIVKFINSSEIIVADLTNERPNCYLEIGYAMGLNKFQNLILTVREDHHQDSHNYNKNGPKVHFDLIGYDILFWDPENLNEFKLELKKRVKRRLTDLETKSLSQNNLRDVIEDLIENNNEIGFKKKLKTIKKNLTEKWLKMYQKLEKIDQLSDEIILSSFKLFEEDMYSFTLIGLILIEYSHDFINLYLNQLQEIYNLSKIIFDGKSGYEYYPSLVDIPKGALHNLYYLLGAFSLKEENLAPLNTLFKKTIFINESGRPKSENIWNSEAIYPQTFDRSPKKIFDFLIESYDYKAYLQEFFRSKDEFITYLCQFNLILCLYVSKMIEEFPENYFGFNPNFSTYRYLNNEILMPLMKCQSNSMYLREMSKVFSEDISTFKDKYNDRSSQINELIGRNSAFSTFRLPDNLEW